MRFSELASVMAMCESRFIGGPSRHRSLARLWALAPSAGGNALPTYATRLAVRTHMAWRMASRLYHFPRYRIIIWRCRSHASDKLGRERGLDQLVCSGAP